MQELATLQAAAARYKPLALEAETLLGELQVGSSLNDGKVVAP